MDLRTKPSNIASSGAVTPDHSFFMQVTRPVMNLKIRNNVSLLPIAEMLTPGLTHENMTAPKQELAKSNNG
jgi:hypothetical protein